MILRNNGVNASPIIYGCSGRYMYAKVCLASITLIQWKCTANMYRELLKSMSKMCIYCMKLIAGTLCFKALWTLHGTKLGKVVTEKACKSFCTPTDYEPNAG